MNSPDPPLPIEDYALIGDCVTAALVGRNGSIDWLCWPRFDGAACFAAMLGDSRNGRWLLAPRDKPHRITRAYRDGTMILETVFETAHGSVALIDFMPRGQGPSSIVRIVEGRGGEVPMAMELGLRFDYGASVPWVTRISGESQGTALCAIAGPDQAVLRTPVRVRGRQLTTIADFTVHQGDRIPFVLSNGPSHLPPPMALDAEQALRETEKTWRAWAETCRYQGRFRPVVQRSLLTLKALSFEATGGIVAAPTTSLPEQLGGTRNWDYRYCWIRDATLTLLALMNAGYYDEAAAWRGWLHRSVAGAPSQIQIMYGLAGERRLDEWEVPWLPGYQGAKPVRIGNAASGQLQLDVFGELMDAVHHARAGGLSIPTEFWDVQQQLVEHLEEVWQLDDEGIWEVRGGRKPFTFSKVMAWVAMDRTVSDMERWNLPGPIDRWRALRDEIHRTTCRDGFNADMNSFTQSFGHTELDASLLMLPLVGFLPVDDPRILGTVTAIERELLVDGFVQRYRTEAGHDGLPPGEGVFLACSFWLADIYKMLGRDDEAEALFAKLSGLCNEVGLLSEEYDPATKRLVGNFPQAFSHIALIGTALHLDENGPVKQRQEDAATPGDGAGPPAG